MSRELQSPVSATQRMGDGPDPAQLHDPDLFDGIVTRRISAYIIDAVILAVIGFAAWFLLSLATALSFGLLMPIQAVILTLLPFAYATWTIGGPSHATYGMRFMDLTVRRALDGRPPDYLQALVMTACFYISVAVTSWLILLAVFFSNRRRTLHDWLAAVVVLRQSRLDVMPPS